MEKEEQRVEQAEMEEQEEETTLVVRKSRNGNDKKTPEIGATCFEVSDGVSDSNGHDIQSELVENVVEDEEKTPAEDQQTEKLNGVLQNEPEAINGVLQNEPEAINGEHKSENLVFYDNVEGVESESTYFGEKQILKVIENNTLSSSNVEPSQVSIQEGNMSYESSKEIESAEVDLIDEDDLEVSEADVERVIKKQTTHDLYCPNCNSCITKRVILRKRKRRVRVSEEEVKRNRTETRVVSILGSGSVQSPSDEVDDKAQISAANEDERDCGPDVFRCFACFSFFIPTGDGFKLFRIFGDKGGKNNVQDDQAPSVKKNWPTAMSTSSKQEPAIVEQGSRDAIVSSNLRDQSGQSSFPQKIQTPTQEEGGDKILPYPNQKSPINENVAVGVDATLELFDSHTTDQLREFESSQVLNGNHETDVSVTTLPTSAQVTNGDLFDSHTTDQLRELKSSQFLNGSRETDLSVTALPTRAQVTNGKSAEDAIFSQEDGLKLLISENKGYSAPDNLEVQISNQTVQPGAADEEFIMLKPTSAPVVKASDVDGNLNFSVSIPHAVQDVRATILTDSILENKNASFCSSDSGHVHHNEVSQHIITKTEIEVHSSEPLKVDNSSWPNRAAILQGKDAVIMIDQQPSESPQTMQVIAHPAGMIGVSQPVTHTSVGDGERTEAGKEFEIEVVKSIVYGGLAESITSLSVVSSAAGGGAATLNVLALGAANLIGGLFVIFHNLWDLKCDRVDQVSNQIVEQKDRYKELLGRRQNFILHAIVAVISYIVFGLVPPIVYGFSFRKSDDKQLKLVVVGAASLLCILILAIGKAYAQRSPKPYLKTVTTFVILGFMVSGVSYAAGELVERLLEKLGLFQTSPVSNLVGPEMGPTGSGWASY